ncbi:hypothetical protein [Halostagnicola kamekurae]|uniref:Uncharacterized protein n=1 Tax=Halostagnicola kamekurae TaxID=619731 RepID=A0A1I6USM3_9EURY|nr:hypothetical protein [Halostagnicola kamekurae]SFT04363.1 hypothetical protein SAMN04488556_4046 [Halostagnicola kamekurae]
MGLSEEEVFQKVTEELETRGYEFFVHCDYDSILSKYKSHTESISGRYPDILGLAPDRSVIAIEVKGSRDLRTGKGQAYDYKAGANYSYLAAGADAVEGYRKTVRDDGLGVITVSADGVRDWKEPSAITNKSQLSEIRDRLAARIRGVEPISKITGLDLAHPVHFLAPAIFLENIDSYQKTMGYNEFATEFEREYFLNGDASKAAIDGATVLGLIDSGSTVTLTDRGRIGLVILNNYSVGMLPELIRLKEETSNSGTLYDIAPLLAVWLLDQYRKHPDFEALYRTIRSFDPEEPILLTELVELLIRDYPNTFLQMFCTDSTESRDQARKLLLKGNVEQIYEDVDLFRQIIRQNLVQNFSRQLQHVGLLSKRTSSTTVRLDEYHPEEYPWLRRSTVRNARLFD